MNWLSWLNNVSWAGLFFRLGTLEQFQLNAGISAKNFGDTSCWKWQSMPTSV